MPEEQQLSRHLLVSPPRHFALNGTQFVSVDMEAKHPDTGNPQPAFLRLPPQLVVGFYPVSSRGRAKVVVELAQRADETLRALMGVGSVLSRAMEGTPDLEPMANASGRAVRLTLDVNTCPKGRDPSVTHFYRDDTSMADIELGDLFNKDFCTFSAELLLRIDGALQGPKSSRLRFTLMEAVLPP